MDDRELLEKYEPVLRFARSERFFPMAVEPYLEKCTLHASGPQGMMALLTHLNEPVRTLVGRMHSGEFYLRFVNDPLIDSDVWVGWGILSATALGVGWFAAGWGGVGYAVILALVAALGIFIHASPIRLRIFPAILVVLIFMALGIAPIWFFLRPHPYISIQVEYLVLFPVYLFVLFFLMVQVMRFIFDRIIPELPGVVMDMFSQATETVAGKAYLQYAGLPENDRQPVYYGRVVSEQDEEGNQWQSLQYHFFYAFNDWRLAANGINHHEGDWEMVAVHLKNGQPYALALSQHGSGAFERWENVYRAKDKTGKETTHPIIYAALGSHANYSKPEVIRSPRLFHEGIFQRLVYWTDGLIHFLFLLFNPSQKARQNALREWMKPPMFLLTEENIENLRDEKDHYIVGLPMEIATGEGFRIGYDGANGMEGVGISTSYLKQAKSDRAVTRPKARAWKQILLSTQTDWVAYKGLWGVKSVLRDESGPSGAKWDRPDKFFAIYPRKRWEKPLEWLRELEDRRWTIDR